MAWREVVVVVSEPWDGTVLGVVDWNGAMGWVGGGW